MVHNNGKNGIMLHRSCDYATVKNNTAYSNGDAGLALYESSFCDVSENTFYHNKCEFFFISLETCSNPVVNVLFGAFSAEKNSRVVLFFIVDSNKLG